MNYHEKLQSIIDLAEEAQQVVDDADYDSLPDIIEDVHAVMHQLLEVTCGLTSL